MAPSLNTLLRAKFRQGEALGYLITLIGRTKKKVYTFLDVLFCTESISEERKKSSLFVMKLPIFYKALGFSLLSL